MKKMVQYSEELKSKLMSATSERFGEGSLSLCAGSENYPWIIDSGATNHMTCSPRRFLSYAPRSGKDRVRIADGSSAPIMGCGTVRCTSSLSLSPVLHVPNFPDLKSGRVLGTGTERDGLYYLDNELTPLALSAMSISTTDEFLLLHYRLGHPSFQSLGRRDHRRGGGSGCRGDAGAGFHLPKCHWSARARGVRPWALPLQGLRRWVAAAEGERLQVLRGRSDRRRQGNGCRCSAAAVIGGGRDRPGSRGEVERIRGMADGATGRAMWGSCHTKLPQYP
ncbi:uncharacterized protein LOC124656163 [Lolium rigidum]|uniref:uncharacterized protein LOC124656163 n=1 Tax=Lolium rigidum TaxID=89674 RepID=UPI001F5D7143|nr:uncharacterized protein LOC124656163 [Lolium rigidum]